jgi:hypothetical protein
MRRLFGSTPTVLARRWAELERLAMVTLYRDQFAEEPGPSVSLALGERTTYRPGAWLLDTFERADLGESYAPPSGSGALVLVGTGVEAAGGGSGAALHARELPRDQWAAVEIAALEVGVILRGDADGYRVTASASATTVARGGTTLGSTPTVWLPGEVLRAEVCWHRVRVYRNAILLLDVEDPGEVGAGRQAGILASGAGRISAWAGGELRQEYLGAVLDMGDVRTVLGEPVQFDLTISNLAPMGGADRFAALLRHGLNVGGTYDLARGTARVYSALHGAEVPLLVGSGLIEGPVDLAEDRARIAVRGRDGFLTPHLDPGPVTYLAGPPPDTAPLPVDPCAPSPSPTVVPGAPPLEPDADDTPGGADSGVGPEAPDGDGGGDETDDGGGALPGAYFIEWSYTVAAGGGAHGEDVYVGTTTVTKVQATPPETRPTPNDWVYTKLRKVCAGSHTFPKERYELFYYRGPDIRGLRLTHNPYDGAQALKLYARAMHQSELGMDVRLAYYQGTRIKTVADLEALRPQNPGEGTDPFPPRVMTLATWRANYGPETWRCEPTTGSYETGICPHGLASAFYDEYVTPATEYTGPLSPVTLSVDKGPQILRIEIDGAPGGTNADLIVELMSTKPNPVSQVSGAGHCGSVGLGRHIISTPDGSMGPNTIVP